MKKLGYEHVVAPVFVIPNDGRTMSNGIFSKFPIVKSKIHTLPDPKTNTRNAIQADIDVQGKIIHVFMTHLLHTHQKSDLVQDSQIDELIKLLPKKNTIAMGDFNMTPESEGIKKMREVMQDAELAPVPTLDPKLFDCKVCDRDKIPTTRLDYIFTSKDIKSDSFKVHDSYGSDHLPISVNLEV